MLGSQNANRWKMTLMSALLAAACSGGGGSDGTSSDSNSYSNSNTNTNNSSNTLGAGDCSGSSALGQWHQTSAIGGDTWNMEDITFSSDCSVYGEEYEGTFRSDSGYFDQNGSDLDIDFNVWDDRQATVDGDYMSMTTGDWYLEYERVSGGPDTNLDQQMLDGCTTTSGITIDRFQNAEPVPPAGIRLTFRVLGCDGNAVRQLTPADVTVINDEKGQAFGSGGEGDSVSDVAPPSNFGLFSVLALDMSDSIINAGAQDDVIDGALAFVDQLVTKPAEGLKHSVAIIAFGRPDALETIQDFTQDDLQLRTALENLRGSPSRGTTDLYDAYMEGLNMVENQGYQYDLVERFMVLLTDGTHEAGDEVNLREQALSAKDNVDASIYSIGIQGNYDESKLIELASTPDNFVRAEDASTLSTAFAQVAEKVEAIARSNYVIGVCTPVALGSPTLTLQVSVDGQSASETVSYSVSQLTGDTSNCDPMLVATGSATSSGGI